MNEVTLGDKIYISSKRAAEITGYAKDYVGQLCREGHVDAKMIGRGWYVYEPSIRAHRFGIESIEQTPVEEEVIEAPVETDTVPDAWEKPVYTSELPQILPELPETAVPAYEEVSPQTEETLTDMQSAWKEWFDRKQQVLSTPEIESPEIIDARNEEYAAEQEDTLEEEAEEVTEDDLSEENADEEVEIPLHRIEEEEEYAPEVHTEAEVSAEPILIHTIQAPVPSYPSYYAAPDTRTQRDPAVVQSVVHEPQALYMRPQAPEAVIINERLIPNKISNKGNRRNKVPKGNPTNAPMIALLIGISIVTIAITVIGSGIADRYVETFSSHNPVIDFLTGTREIKK